MADQVLFKFKEYVQLWQTDRNVPNINGPMIQYNTTIYKGATNTIDFVVRNNDRKPVNLVGYQIVALIQRVENPEVLLEKSVTVTDERSGKARLILVSADIADWYAGFYRYTIRLTDVTGKQEFLYTDVNRSTYGQFELIEGLAAALSPAIDLPADKFTPFPRGPYDSTWSTGALPGAAQSDRAAGMHTVVAYTSHGWIGDLRIQASLTMDAPGEGDWFDVPVGVDGPEFKYTKQNSPSVKVFNFTGNYYWVRMQYHTDPVNTGQFNRILYKI